MIADELLIQYQAEIIQADQERVEQAWWAAYCELGPEPAYVVDPRAHEAYVVELTKLARKKFDHLN